VGEVRYKPYGEVRQGYPVGVMPTDRLYTGQRWDSALGLYDYRARYYDPLLGRFISADPVVREPGNPQSLNRYAYVYNNPLRYADPDGHVPVILVMMAAGAASGFLINYGFQVAANISQNGLNVQAFTDVNWASVGASAVAGAVGGAAFYGISAVIAAATGATGIGLGNIALSGQVERVMENALTGQSIGSGLGNPEDLARDAALGGVLAFVGGVADQAIIAARFPGFYSRRNHCH